MRTFSRFFAAAAWLCLAVPASSIPSDPLSRAELLGPESFTYARILAGEPPAAAARRILADHLPRVEGSRLRLVSTQEREGNILEVRLRQEVEGIPVFRGTHSVFFRPDGRVLALKRGAVPGSPTGIAFAIAAEDAAAIAEGHLEGTLPRTDGLHKLPSQAEGFLLRSPRHEAPIFAAQVVLPGLHPQPAWRVELQPRNDPSSLWMLLIHAGTGEVLQARDLTRHVEARGLVYPEGVLGGPARMVDFIGTDVILDPASPLGWVAADSTTGNNMTVWEDRAGDGTGTDGILAVGTGDPVTFDFPFTATPVDDIEAALVNVFWALNSAHDRFYHLGFDESAGSAQTDNFGRGGEPGDYTRVFVQYRAGADASTAINYSSTYAPSDGNYNSIVFGLWDRSGEIRDAAFDTGLLFHEYTHLVVSRMVGNDTSCDDGIQPRPLAEGWADYFAYAFTGDRLIGGWVSGNQDTGLRTRKVGDNFYGYANLCNILGENSCNNERNGEIWSAALYDLRQAMIQAYGAQAGALEADRLIVEGMRYTPCAPTYLQARDGILMADEALNGGRDHCLLWNVFRFRGMGYSSWSDGPEDRNPQFALDLPPQCESGASLHWDRPHYGLDADARITLIDSTQPGTPRPLTIQAGSGDEETVEASGVGMFLGAELPLRPGTPVPGDGVLQVAHGDLLTVVCADCPGAPSAEVPVTSILNVGLNSYSITSESCHDDDADPNISDFRNEVTGILDAGERANFNVDLGNAEPFALEDVQVRVTSDNPAVHVVPEGWIPIGAVPAKTRFARSFRVDLRLLADPDPGIQFGDIANITFEVQARGAENTVDLTLPLASDYQDLRGLLAWDGVETFEVDSPTADQWTHVALDASRPADQWGIQDCGDGGGRAMTYSGPSCTEYDDTPAAATLTSPPLFDPALGLQSVHLVDFNWRNEVDLGYDPRSGYCDSEMVTMYFTDDPGRVRYEEPRTLRFDGIQYWVEWPGLQVTRDTNGWATEGPRTTLQNNTINAMDLDNIRLHWVFFTDVYTPENSGGCRTNDPDAIAGGYKLDNVRFEYDAVNLAPPVDTTCADTCVVGAHMTMTPTDGGTCPGDIITLDAQASSAFGCPGGELEYRFNGPGFSTGYQPDPVVQVEALPDANWSLTVRCVADTGCSDGFSIRDRTLADSYAGRIYPKSLRLAKSDRGVRLSWNGTRAPEAYAVFGGAVNRTNPGGVRTLLESLGQDPPQPEWRLGNADSREYTDRNVPFGDRVHFYRVFSRIPCTDEAVIP